MQSLGQQFKQAREARKMSISEAAAATRIMRHQLEAIENDNWSKIPAPAYAKGFIKIYAQYLRLDAAPMIRQYVEEYVNPLPLQPEPEPVPKAPLRTSIAESTPAPAHPEEDDTETRPLLTANPELFRRMAYVCAGLLLLFFLGLFGVRSCTKIMAQRTEKPASDLVEIKSTLVVDPPEPYLDIE